MQAVQREPQFIVKICRLFISLITKEIHEMRYSLIIFILILFGTNTFALDELDSDTNQDGKIDKWITKSPGAGTLTITMDQNYDEAIDYKGEFTKDWKPVFEEFDDNGDGAMDTFYYYDKGALIRQEVDSNYDGKIDIWIYLYSSVYITKYAADTDFDGTIDKVIDYGKKKIAGK
jgi:hypothetical protein